MSKFLLRVTKCRNFCYVSRNVEIFVTEFLARKLGGVIQWKGGVVKLDHSQMPGRAYHYFDRDNNMGCGDFHWVLVCVGTSFETKYQIDQDQNRNLGRAT